MAIEINTSAGNTIEVTQSDGTSVTFNQETSSVSVSSPASTSVQVLEKGVKGDKGDTGATGPGLASGGTENQFIQKNSAADYDTKWSAYTLPAADGEDGQVLTTNGAATVTFAYPKTIAEDVKNVSGGPLTKGTPVHVTGSVGNLAEVIAADAATNYPAHFVLNQDLANEEEGLGIAIGFINNVDVPDASIYTEGQTVYLGASGGWTTTKPTGANAIQNLGIIIKVNTSGNKISGIIMGAGRANDVPNIATGNIWAGNVDGVATATDTAYIDIANSKVGIGTTSPSYKLHVDGGTIGSNLDSTGNNTSRQVNMTSANTIGMNTFTAYNTNTDVTPDFLGKYGYKFEGGTATANKQFQLYVSDLSNPRMVVNGSGNVGIGTTSPTQKLHVDGSVQIGQNSTIWGTNTVGSSVRMLDLDSGNNIEIGIGGGTNSFNYNNVLYAAAGGNVGIGTTSPLQRLHIKDGTDVNLQIGAVGSELQLKATNDADSAYIPMILRASEFNMLSGNVGIGTTSPTSKLDVNGGVTASGPIDSSDATNTAITSETARFNKYGLMANRGSMYITNYAAGGSILFGIGGVHSAYNKMALAGTGHLGVGTTSPSARLDSRVDDGNTHSLRLGRTDTSSFWDFIHAGDDLRIYNAGGSGKDILLGVNSGGVDQGNKVGIGTASPAYKLDVSGSARITTDNPVLQIADTDNTIRYAALELNTLGGRWFLSSGDSNAGAGVANSDLWITRNSSGTDNRFRFYRDVNRFGIYSSGTQGVQLDADGISYFNAGNVGIGTASPVSPLHVYSNNAITGTGGGLTIEQDGTGDALLQFLLTASKRWVVGIDNDDNNNFKISGTSDLSTDNGLTITNSTYNVGIGTASPSKKLHVVGDAVLDGGSFNLTVDHGSNSGGYGISLNGTGSNLPFLRWYDGTTILAGMRTASNGNFTIQTNGFNDRLTINSSGNVGIGTTSPSAKLDVAGLANINDGSNNVMISSGNTASITGVENTTLGYRAGINLTSGNKNTAVGKDALYAAATATRSDNTAVGHGALFQVTGDSNVGIGRNAGLKATTGNVAIGNFSLDDNTGSLNVSIGYGAMGATGSTASNTLAIGYQALARLTSGAQNTAVGHQALQFVTNANNNTAIGYEALENSDTSYNTSIGAYCLKDNTLGERNTAIGWHASSLTTGSYNASLGMRAGRYGGIGNTAIGYDAASNTTGDNNVVIGREAGLGVASTSNYSNTVAVGYQALYDLTTGNYNTAVGHQSLTNITTANGNTAVGFSAGFANILGTDNSFVGAYSGTNSTGSSNTAIGYGAVYTNTTGDNNTAIGRNSLFFNTTGGQNVVIGRDAGKGASGASTFSNTTAVGYQALQDLTTGGQNTAVGHQAFTNITTGANNTAVGYQAGSANILGDSNSFFGVYAGVYTTGSANTALGHSASFSNTTGNNNVAIGRSAGFSNTTGSGNIFIGYQAGYNETGSNKLYIANSDTSTPLIYGDFNLGGITINGDLNVSGGNLRADAVEINGRALTTPSTGEYGAGSRLVTQFASGTVTAGKVYVANAGSWAEGDANAGSTSIGMIAVATDAASATEMLIEGVIKLSSNTGFSGAAAGTVLYLSTTAGELTTTAPSTAGEYVRVCGYVVNASTNEVFFSPSRDWTAL